jgi:Ran GTPase-activating protein (RanGAP) involved in mRNA processing and transport
LTKFDISINEIRAEGGKALAVGLKGNQAIIELNIANNDLGWNANTNENMSGIVALADVIAGMGALLSLDISDNHLYVDGIKLLAKALESNQTMTSLNISSNAITYDGKKGGYISGVAALADVIPGMGAMTSLDVSNNGLWAEGTKLLAEALKGNKIMTELNLSSNYVTEGGLSGVVALADAIPDMGALSSLNLAANRLCGIDEYGRGTYDASGNTHPLYHMYIP